MQAIIWDQPGLRLPEKPPSTVKWVEAPTVCGEDIVTVMMVRIVMIIKMMAMGDDEDDGDDK